MAVSARALTAPSAVNDVLASLGPLLGQPYLLLDLDAPLDRLATPLPALPCPVIGVGDANAPLAPVCDVVVADIAAAAPLCDRILRTPLAATVLVQTLRVTESLPLAAALSVESLAYATLQAGAEFRRWLSGYQASASTHPDGDGLAVVIERDADTLTLTLNRPRNRNAMTVEMRDALCEALQLVLSDDLISRVHLGARGRCFSTGGDLDEFGSAPDAATAHAVRSVALPGRLLAACADRVEVHVHGACVGSGIEFPAFAGRLVADPGAWFQLPELKYGLIPGAGGCVSVARRIGRQRTAAWVLSGRRIDAPTALAWGLVDAVA